MELLAEAVELLKGGGAAAIATVIRTSGSTPRHAGARMVITDAGERRGTIGGGRVEKEVMAAALEVARGGPARRVVHHLVRDLAMCCGGSMELYIEPLAQSVSVLEQAVELWRQRRVGRLITPLSGGPKRLEETDDIPVSATFEGDELIEPVRPSERLILFGAGHVGRAIAPLCQGIGFSVVVCDDDETGELASPPECSQTIDSFDMRDVERTLGPLGVADYVVIVTRDHAIDQRLLEHLIGNERLSYLGVIGSLGKVARFRKRLAAKGIAGDDDWGRVSAPIGLDIRAETPEEIAISVVAELIMVRNGEREKSAT